MKWECEFKQQLAIKLEMKSSIESLKFDMGLEPRQAFFEGRTNAVCLYKEVNESEKIHYVDFTSLYPWTNKYCEILIQHPEILTSEALLNRSPQEFFGLIKCDILPPTFLFHPVLPYRASGKLMFPLCRTCAETLQQTPCELREEERTLSGTWCSIEIDKTLELGYRVVRMIEVWHFPQKSSTLLTGYVDNFIKLNKRRAAGPPGVRQKVKNNSILQNMNRKKASSWSMKRLRRTQDYDHWPS